MSDSKHPMPVQGGGAVAGVRGLSGDRRGGADAGCGGLPVPVPHGSRAAAAHLTLHDPQSGVGSAITSAEGSSLDQSQLRSPTSLRDTGNVPFDPGSQSDIPVGLQRGCSAFGVGARLVNSDAVLEAIETMNLICWNCRGLGPLLVIKCNTWPI